MSTSKIFNEKTIDIDVPKKTNERTKKVKRGNKETKEK